eukprot:COSAG02_NODE_527_length_20704_cov_120.745462_13_plen_512_part_00
MSSRSIAAVHETLGLVATKPGVNLINGGGGSKPWEAKCCRSSLGTFATEEEAFQAYVAECHRRGMVPRMERAMRAGNPALASTGDRLSGGAASKRGSWTPEETQRMHDAVAEQLHEENSVEPGPSFDWASIADALQTGRSGGSVYQKWARGNRKRSTAPVASAPSRSKRQRRHKVLPDDEVDIDHVDQDYFERWMDASGGAQCPDNEKKSRHVGAETGEEQEQEEAQQQPSSYVLWTAAETKQLFQMVQADGSGAWAAKAAALGTHRTPRAVCQMYYTLRDRMEKQERLPQSRAAAGARGRSGMSKAPASRPHVVYNNAGSPPTSSFSGIEYVQADACWKLIPCVVLKSKRLKLAQGGLQSAQSLRFDSEAAAARAYDSIVGQRVNYSLGDVVATVSFEMVGQGVQVTWNAAETYCGEILAVDLRTNKARIKYDDGQTAWELVTNEDILDIDVEDAVNVRLLVPNTTASLVGIALDDAEAASIDVDVIRQYLSFWYTAARHPQPAVATSGE